MIKDFRDILKTAASIGPKIAAVAAAGSRETMSAVVEAKNLGIIEPLLVGNREYIEKSLVEMGANPDEYKCVNELEAGMAASMAVSAVHAGEAHILMKGNIPTSKFVGAALTGKDNLRTGGLLSDVEVFEDSRKQHHKLVIASDGGINIAPGIKEKLAIIRNAVKVAHRLGNKHPKVALLSGSERVHPDLQSTIDAVAIVKMCQSGEISNCFVDGPFALDNVIDAESARAKGIESPVAGQADVLIMPNMEAGNIFTKSLQYYGGLEIAHVALGASAPILIPSRTAPVATKLRSLALAVLMCD